MTLSVTVQCVMEGGRLLCCCHCSLLQAEAGKHLNAVNTARGGRQGQVMGL